MVADFCAVRPVNTKSAVRGSGGPVIRNSMAYEPPPLSLSWPHLADPGHEIVNPVKKRKARF